MTDSLALLLLVGLLALLVMAAIAPLDALGWWAGWWGRARYTFDAAEAAASAEPPEHFVIYLSGVGSIANDWQFPEELAFTAALNERLGRAVIVDDIFPYAVAVRDLSDEGAFRRLWGVVQRARSSDPNTVLGWLLMVRNAFRMAVSVDHRYGPYYNLANAVTIREALRAHGYQRGSGQRVVLIGYSGGAQLVVAAATFLTRMLRAPVRVISIGGAVGSDPGLLWAEHVYHLRGERDPIDRLSNLLFAGRWPLLRESAWNVARREGRLTFVPMGPMGHTGTTGYYGAAPLPDGTPRLDRTVAIVAALIRSTPD